jgi:hypothetical protein
LPTSRAIADLGCVLDEIADVMLCRAEERYVNFVHGRYSALPRTVGRFEVDADVADGKEHSSKRLATDAGRDEAGTERAVARTDAKTANTFGDKGVTPFATEIDPNSVKLRLLRP